MPFFLIALGGAALAIASNAVDNLTEKKPASTPPDGGTNNGFDTKIVTIPLMIAGTILLIKQGNKLLK